MKFLDEKGRLFGKLSIVDLFVILLVLACIGAVGLKLRASKTVSGGDRTITYAVRIENIRDVSVEAINSKKDGLIDIEKKKELGSIESVEATPARVLVQTNDGKFKFAEYDNRYDAVITIKTSGTETEDGYYASSGRQISVGESIGINSGAAQFFAEVISVTAE